MTLESVTVVLTDGIRVLMSENDDTKKKRELLGGRIEDGETDRETAVREVLQKTKGRVSLAEERLIPLDGQVDDEETVHCFICFITETELNNGIGSGRDNAQQLSAVELDQVSDKLQDKELKKWWESVAVVAMKLPRPYGRGF